MEAIMVVRDVHKAYVMGESWSGKGTLHVNWDCEFSPMKKA